MRRDGRRGVDGSEYDPEGSNTGGSYKWTLYHELTDGYTSACVVHRDRCPLDGGYDDFTRRRSGLFPRTTVHRGVRRTAHIRRDNLFQDRVGTVANSRAGLRRRRIRRVRRHRRNTDSTAPSVVVGVKSAYVASFVPSKTAFARVFSIGRYVAPERTYSDPFGDESVTRCSGALRSRWTGTVRAIEPLYRSFRPGHYRVLPK